MESARNRRYYDAPTSQWMDPNPESRGRDDPLNPLGASQGTAVCGTPRDCRPSMTCGCLASNLDQNPSSEPIFRTFQPLNLETENSTANTAKLDFQLIHTSPYLHEALL